MSSGKTEFSADDGAVLLLWHPEETAAARTAARFGMAWDENGGLLRGWSPSAAWQPARGGAGQARDPGVTIQFVFNFRRNDIVGGSTRDRWVFKFGALETEDGVDLGYYRIEGRVLGIAQDVLLCSDRPVSRWSLGWFGAGFQRRTSIFKKISSAVASDESEIVIGGPAEGSVPWGTFDELLSSFPTTAELERLGAVQISDRIADYLPLAGDFEEDYAKCVERVHAHTRRSTSSNRRRLSGESERERLGNDRIAESSRASIDEALRLLGSIDEEGWRAHDERYWQKRLLAVLPALYPQYVAAIKEKGLIDLVSKKGRPVNRRLDYLMIEASGNVDIAELKAPVPKERLIRKRKYRGNYVPAAELAGAIEQVEKYLYHLNHLGAEGERKFSEECKRKLVEGGGPELPEDLQLRCIDPHGIIIMGHADFDEDEQRDFDIIRRQYAHVVDIVTYDDLRDRLRRMRDSLG